MLLQISRWLSTCSRRCKRYRLRTILFTSDLLYEKHVGEKAKYILTGSDSMERWIMLESIDFSTNSNKPQLVFVKQEMS